MAEFNITLVQGSIKLANFDEIKKDIEQELTKYKVAVISNENYREVKTYRAKLNNFEKALGKAKTDNKKAYLEPYLAFEEQIKELQSMVSEISSKLDDGIKEIENREKNAKRLEIDEFYLTLNMPVKIDKVYDEKWENKTYKIEDIKKELLTMKAQIDQDLNYIEQAVSNDNLLLKANIKHTYLNTLHLIESITSETEKYDNAKNLIVNTGDDLVKDIPIIVSCNRKQWDSLVNYAYQLGIKVKKQ